MSYEVRNESKTTIIAFTGRLEGNRSTDLRDYFKDVFETHPQRILLDLSQVTLLASTGLALIVSIYKRCTEADIPLALCGLAPQVREVVAVTNLDSILPIHGSVGEALSSLEASS